MLFKRAKAEKSSSAKFETFADSYVSKAQQAIWRNVDGKGVVLNTKTASYFTLEETALRIWELIEKGIIVSELIEAISCEYSANIKIVKKDVMEILDSMKKEGIIEFKPREGKGG